MLECFETGDDSVLELLLSGEFEPSPGVTDRWIRCVEKTLSCRMTVVGERLQKRIDREVKDEHSLARAMLQTRIDLIPLARFVKLPCCSEELRRVMVSELERWITETQSALENSLKHIRHDQGRLLKALRDTPLKIPSVDIPDSTGDLASSQKVGFEMGKRRRNVILEGRL